MFLSAEKKDNELLIKRAKDSSYQKAAHGLFRSLIANAVAGMEKPWAKRLEVVGTGFNVKLVQACKLDKGLFISPLPAYSL